jgi:hypothetical protein
VNTRLTLKGDVPSKKNSKRVFCRGGRPVVLPSEAYVAWHEEQLYALPKTKNAPLGCFTSIVCTFYPRTKRKADLSNKFESVADLLVDALILEDDNWFILGEVVLRFGGVDTKNPRVEIVIES